MDGHKAVEFCKVCGAEGLELVDDCPRIINSNKKALDEKEQTAKEAVTGIGE
jgi:hypothetical protein